MTENNPPFELDKQDADLVYSLAAARDCVPGQSGLVFSARSSGLYRSQDGGQSWEYALENLALTEELPVTALSLSRNFLNDGLVIAGAPGGIFHSSDSGRTWKALIFPNPPPTVSFLAFSPNFDKDETVFAGTMEDGVFISLNGGERWVAWNFGLLDLNVMCLAISTSFQSDETIFAGTESGIFRSTNGGRAWREIELPFGFEAVLSLAISPSFKEDGTLFAGTEGQGLWISNDSGETWARSGEGLIEDPVNAIQLTKQGIFAFTSTALWHSIDQGKTWVNRLPVYLAEAEISCGLVIEQDDLHLSAFAGMMDGSICTLSIL